MLRGTKADVPHNFRCSVEPFTRICDDKVTMSECHLPTAVQNTSSYNSHPNRSFGADCKGYRFPSLLSRPLSIYCSQLASDRKNS